MDPYRSVNICFITTLLFWAFSVAAVYVIYFQIGINKFTLFTDIENSIQNTVVDHSTYITGCTNESIGTNDKTFMGKTLVAYNCQQSENPCLVTICNENRVCEEQEIANATCSHDSNCDPHFRCDLDLCSCVENPMLSACVENSDCPIVDNNPCANFTCVNEVCVLDTLPGMECSTNQNCGSDEFCTNNCTCFFINITETGFCEQNSNCPAINNNVCEDFSCNLSNNTCIRDTIPIVPIQCATNQDCFINEYCTNDCICQAVDSRTIGKCSQDSDCPVIEDNPCESYTCQSGICTLDTLPGMECASGQDCGSNEFCSENCTCVTINTQAFGICSVNSDCPTVDNNPCANFTCQTGRCVFNTTDGNECSSNQQCGTDEFCDDTCSCQSYLSVTETIDTTLTFDSGNIIVAPANFSKVGDHISLYVETITGTVVSGPRAITVAAGQIPIGYEPNFLEGNGLYIVRSMTITTNSFSFCNFHEDGSIEFYRDLPGNGFVNGDFAIYAFVFSWIHTP